MPIPPSHSAVLREKCGEKNKRGYSVRPHNTQRGYSVRPHNTRPHNTPGLLAAALGDIARARGMTEIAEAAGITREALYKALRPDSAPRFDTVSRVCAALGVRLVAQPVPPRKAAA